MKILALASVLALSTGCLSEVTQLQPADPLDPQKCNVRVYTSRAAAEKDGAIEEMCIVSGRQRITSNSVAAAIQDHKQEVCKCGTDKAFIQTASEGNDWGNATVTLVGFKRK